jgi:multidrug efflux pump subunit AcrB
MTKLCPFCAEEIRFGAIKCRYCNERLDTQPGPEPSIGQAARALATSAGATAFDTVKRVTQDIHDASGQTAQVGLVIVIVIVLVLLLFAIVIHPVAAVLGIPVIVVGYIVGQIMKKLL